MPSIPGLASPVTASEYADRYGIADAIVVSRIREGTVKGAKYGGVWYAEDAPPDTEPAALAVVRPEDRVQERTRRPASLPKVIRYTSWPYVYSIMGLLAVVIAVDGVSFVFSHDVADLRGVGTRVLVLAALRTQHRWARRAVLFWAGSLVLGGGAGLFLVLTAGGAEAGVPWWGPALFGGSLVVGLFYLVTAHRYIKVEEPADEDSPPTLDEIAREARLG